MKILDLHYRAEVFYCRFGGLGRPKHRPQHAYDKIRCSNAVENPRMRLTA